MLQLKVTWLTSPGQQTENQGAPHISHTWLEALVQGKTNSPLTWMSLCPPHIRNKDISDLSDLEDELSCLI